MVRVYWDQLPISSIVRTMRSTTREYLTVEETLGHESGGKGKEDVCLIRAANKNHEEERQFRPRMRGFSLLPSSSPSPATQSCHSNAANPLSPLAVLFESERAIPGQRSAGAVLPPLSFPSNNPNLPPPLLLCGNADDAIKPPSQRKGSPQQERKQKREAPFYSPPRVRERKKR